MYKWESIAAQQKGGAQKFGELSDIDVSHALPRRLHQLVFTGSKGVAFADPTQLTGWLIDIQISTPYVIMGQQHKIRRVMNSSTRLCSYVPETKNVVISELYTLKTSNDREGVLKIVSEFHPPGLIGAGTPVPTILLEVVLGDPPIDFVTVLPGLKLKWTNAHSQRELGVYIRVLPQPLVRFTLEGVWHEAEYRILDISEIYLGPVGLKRLRVTSAGLTLDEGAVVLGHLKLPESSDG